MSRRIGHCAQTVRQGLRFLLLVVACFMYLREATKGAEEGSLHHWRCLVIVTRLLYAMDSLHLFDFAFLEGWDYCRRNRLSIFSVGEEFSPR